MEFKMALAVKADLFNASYRPGNLARIRKSAQPTFYPVEVGMKPGTVQLVAASSIAIIAGLALNSDTLKTEVIITSHKSTRLDIVDPSAIEVPSQLLDRSKAYFEFLDDFYVNQQENIFDPTLDPTSENFTGSVVEHRKGGIYTIFAVIPDTRNGGSTVIYMSHEDGNWWTRPWSEFSDGRFKSAAEDPLDIDAIYLSQMTQGYIPTA